MGKKILVTGFTGNAGHQVALSLLDRGSAFQAAVRNVEKAKAEYGGQFQYVPFDLTDPASFDKALQGIDRVFLMYPPNAGGPEWIKAFVDNCRNKGVRHIVYLSVKDVQYMPFLPHYQNEKAIQKSGISYTFLRAGYFMQNFNLFLLDEIIKNNRIYVPAGRGKTSFVDVRDVAEAAALVLNDPIVHRNKSYTLTGNEALTFYDAAKLLSAYTGRVITYASPSSKEFQHYMQQKGIDPDFVKIAARLHMLTKYGFAKGIAEDFQKLMNKAATSLEQYFEDYREDFQKDQQ